MHASFALDSKLDALENVSNQFITIIFKKKKKLCTCKFFTLFKVNHCNKLLLCTVS